MAKKKFDPKAKAKRQKVLVAVGGVLLLGVLAFQVPRTMKMLKQQNGTASSTPATTTTSSTTAGSTPLAPPSLGGSAAAPASASVPGGGSVAATSADGVTDPSNPLPPSAGQLVSFSNFKGKDPFHQQIASDCASDPASGAPAACASASTSGSAASSSSATSSSDGQATKKSAATGLTGTKLAVAAPKLVAAKPTTAMISVNGATETVSVGNSFPSSSPVFTLVSVTTGAAKIGIAGGSYANGAQTVTVKKGKTVTLMNTADGTRYVLRLVATG
jgi:hypothetical protein